MNECTNNTNIHDFDTLGEEFLQHVMKKHVKCKRCDVETYQMWVLIGNSQDEEYTIRKCESFVRNNPAIEVEGAF